MKKALKIMLVAAAITISTFSLAACEADAERIVTDTNENFTAVEA